MAKVRINASAKKLVGNGTSNVFYYDTLLQGFGVRVTKAGSRSFIYQYKSPRTGLHRRMTIGKVEHVNAARARVLAKNLEAQVSSGVDPLDEKAEYREQWNCQDMIESYLADLRERVNAGSRSASYLRGTESRLRCYVRDGLGKRKVGDVDLALVQTIQKQALKGGGYQSNRCLSLIRELLKHAKRHGQIEVNVAESAEPLFQEKERERYLDADELQRLGDAITELEARGANRMHLRAILLIMFTGCRKNEICRLQWDEVDFDNAALRLTRFKGSTSSKRTTKVVPLSPAAIEVLRRCEDDQFCGLVFPSVSTRKRGSGTRIVPVRDPNRYLKKALVVAGIDPTNVVLHTLRHSYASILVLSNVHKTVIGSLLGHKSSRSTDRYLNAEDNAQRAATELIGNVLKSKNVAPN